MKNNIFILAAILALLATACKKENPQNDLAVTPITISASYGISDDAKVSYTESGNDITATWEAGDQLYVVYNNHVNTLTLSAGAGTASATFTGSIVGTPTATSPLFCYVRDANNPSAVTVSPTGEYTYASGTFLAQDGTLASAAKCNLFYGATTYGNGTNISCTFSPNTSMMKLTVSAPAGVLAGATATLTYKSATTDLAKATFTIGANGWNTLYLTVPAGEYTGEQTLVYHSGIANETRTLSATQACFAAGQTYSKRVKFGNPIPDGAIDGTFTVGLNADSSPKKVYFSKGNLQYSNGTWSFHVNQYDRCFTSDGNVSANYTSTGTFDLFGWGTSNYDHGGTCYQPWSTDRDESKYYAYGNKNYNLYSQTGRADWGYNAIYNGGNMANSGWRTLTNEEWGYVFTGRTDAASKRGHGNVNGVNGIILLPDDWTLPGGVSFTPGSSNWTNVYTSSDWAKMEANGAVFLPAAGYRYGTTLVYSVDRGYYWSSSNYGANAHSVEFYSETLYPQEYGNRSDGYSVRLVRNVE